VKTKWHVLGTPALAISDSHACRVATDTSYSSSIEDHRQQYAVVFGLGIWLCHIHRLARILTVSVLRDFIA
jgi:hypothetical protein